MLRPKVAAESLWIYADASRTKKLQITVDLLETVGVDALEITLGERERVLLVQYAFEMDDGEAEALSVARNRSMPILSDDYAVARVAPRDGIVLLTTLDLLGAWSECGVTSQHEVAFAAYAMQRRANYAAPRRHPRGEWYRALVREAESRTS